MASKLSGPTRHEWLLPVLGNFTTGRVHLLLLALGLGCLLLGCLFRVDLSLGSLPNAGSTGWPGQRQVALASWHARGSRIPVLAAGWFSLCLLPTSLLPTVDLIVERRAYLASVGALLAFSACLSLLPAERPGIAVASAAAVVAVQVGVCRQRALIFAREETVWEDVLAQYPWSIRARHNLATLLLNDALNAAGGAGRGRSTSSGASTSSDGRVLAGVGWKGRVAVADVERLRRGEAILASVLHDHPEDEYALNNLGALYNDEREAVVAAGLYQVG